MTEASAPAVTVLLAVHDGEEHLETALRSIMEQSLRDIEILVVDDASTDGTPQILARLAAEDARIRVLRPPQNLKLPGALNYGLERARGALIARMDDDDISLPRRLEVQKAFLDAHPDHTLVGTSIEWMDDAGRTTRRSIRPRDSFATRWTLRFLLNVSHPTFMFRPAMPDGTPVRYDPASSLTEDHELVCRLVTAGARVTNLPEVLLRYRRHPGSVSVARWAEQTRQARPLCTAFQRAELPEPVFEALEPVRELFFDLASATPARSAAALAGVRAMLAHDLAQAPERAAWLRRRSAQLSIMALRRGRISTPDLVRALARHGRGLVLPAALRALETKGWLPAALHSDPLRGRAA